MAYLWREGKKSKLEDWSHKDFCGSNLEESKKKAFYSATFLVLSVSFIQNFDVFHKVRFFKCAVDNQVELNPLKWLRELFLLLIADLLIFRKFENGKFFFFHSARQNVIAIRACTCKDSATLPYVFQSTNVWVLVTNGSCTPCNKTWLLLGSWKGQRSLQWAIFCTWDFSCDWIYCILLEHSLLWLLPPPRGADVSALDKGSGQ